jgi:hypothetical protein
MTLKAPLKAMLSRRWGVGGRKQETIRQLSNGIVQLLAFQNLDAIAQIK